MRSLNLILFACSLSLLLAVNGCNKEEVEIEEDAAVVEPDLTAPQVDKKVVTPDTAPKPDTKAGAPDLMPSFDAWKTCKIEIDITTLQPCDCFGTKVYDVKAQYPDCVAPKILKCCPAIHAPKCE